MTVDEQIKLYLAKKQQITALEKEVAATREMLLNMDGYDSDRYNVQVKVGRRTVLRSMADLQERFTPTELKGLLGIVKTHTLRIHESK